MKLTMNDDFYLELVRRELFDITVNKIPITYFVNRMRPILNFLLMLYTLYKVVIFYITDGNFKLKGKDLSYSLFD